MLRLYAMWLIRCADAAADDFELEELLEHHDDALRHLSNALRLRQMASLYHH